MTVQPHALSCPVCGRALEGVERMIGLSRDGQPMSEPFCRTLPCNHKVDMHVINLETQDFELRAHDSPV